MSDHRWCHLCEICLVFSASVGCGYLILCGVCLLYVFVLLGSSVELFFLVIDGSICVQFVLCLAPQLAVVVRSSVELVCYMFVICLYFLLLLVSYTV